MLTLRILEQQLLLVTVVQFQVLIVVALACNILSAFGRVSQDKSDSLKTCTKCKFDAQIEAILSCVKAVSAAIRHSSISALNKHFLNLSGSFRKSKAMEETGGSNVILHRDVHSFQGNV